jgi:hypothetical protein
LKARAVLERILVFPCVPGTPDLYRQAVRLAQRYGIHPYDGANSIIRASAPVCQGRETCDGFRVLGTCPAPAAGSADITSLYTARASPRPWLTAPHSGFAESSAPTERTKRWAS